MKPAPAGEVAPNGKIETRLESSRAPEVLNLAGHSTITNIGFDLRRDTTNHGPITYTGTNSHFSYQAYGALGGQFYFNRVNLGYGVYHSLGQDLLGRRTVLSLNVDGGYIFGDAPFYERYYGGGIGSIRGFEYRGVGPRDGYDHDPVGGDLNLDSTLQVSYPIYSDSLRGVVFTDVGTVEQGIEIHRMRASVGFGVRLVLPFLGQAPLALDFAIPYSKEPLDETQYFSFQFGSNF
jgi:outer membrane protein insertion porin family